jgi:DNA-entry nuclease
MRRPKTFWQVARSLVLVLLTLALGFGVGMLATRLYASWGSDQAAETGEGEGAGSDVPVATPAYSAWDQDESPNYYRVLGKAHVGTRPPEGTVVYGRLDALGRATGAVALVTYDSMEAGRARSREDVSELYPSGWGHNQEVDIALPDGTVYHGFLYNRSHLVAKSLGGDDALHNLICGTRTQNVGANIEGYDGGMAYCESLARQWLVRHKEGTVYYAAMPAYEGDELVARSVIVDIRSSDGAVDVRIEVYNAAKGFEIDYATGAFEVTEAIAPTRQVQDASKPADGAEVVPSGSPESSEGERKVIVTGSGKAYHHDETCSGLANARSMEWVTVGEAEDMGRHPCSICGG